MEASRGIAVANIGTIKKVKSMVFEDLKEDLLPGIPNEITLDSIIPKIPWGNLRILSWVSHGFRNAIQSHLVYDARVRANSTETFVVVVLEKCQNPDWVSKSGFEIFLYSIRDKTREKLPPIPDVCLGIPVYCQYVSLKDKIYVLGGEQSELEVEYSCGSPKVFMLDLAGERQWRRCANMQEPRRCFGAGVKDGKIYVFGGIFARNPVCGCEVYDPTFDAWSSILPMKYFRYAHEVAILGEELLVFGGAISVSPAGALSPDERLTYRNKSGFSLSEIYDPAKDEWRLIEEALNWRNVFIAQDKVHLMNKDGIFVYSFDTHSMTILHSHSLVELGGGTNLDVYVRGPLAVDGELLVNVVWTVTERKTHKISLLQSTGFGSDKKEILWKEVISLPWEPNFLSDLPFITIQL